MVSLQRT